nr:MAG TPA: hypothetical protein [Caudoviricetes sp.]
MFFITIEIKRIVQYEYIFSIYFLKRVRYGTKCSEKLYRPLSRPEGQCLCGLALLSLDSACSNPCTTLDMSGFVPVFTPDYAFWLW